MGQKEEGQSGILSYEILPGRDSPRLKLRMKMEGRDNVVHIFPALSSSYRCLGDIRDDVLGVEGKEGIYGDLKKIGDLRPGAGD